MNKMNRYVLLLACTSLLAGACRKFVQVDPPRNSVPTSALFNDSASASNALTGVYSKMSTGYGASPGFGAGSVTLFGGQSADELNFTSTDQTVALNTIAQDNGNLKIMWQDAYTFIYQANLCIEGLDASTLLDAANKARFRAEARFIRAFNYFYLVNLWGDVPYVTTSDWTKTFGTGRTPAATIYSNMVDDLLAAQADMPVAYPAAGKVRPIRLSATALLARVYLYMGEWAKADAAASVVIN